MSVAEKIIPLRKSIREMAAAAKRNPEEIQFILVTKTVALERIAEAFRSGVHDFGENRVQELIEKKNQWKAAGLPDVRWHMIGHLQTNKVKQVIGEVVLIHSLDRFELVHEIEKQAQHRNISQVNCLIQVKTSNEPAKYGIPLPDVFDFATSIEKKSQVCIRGLMTIAPFTDDTVAIRNSFRSLKKLQEELRRKLPGKSWDMLSMGMSGDYGIAIEEGANLLRIGRAVFGERKTQ